MDKNTFSLQGVVNGIAIKDILTNSYFPPFDYASFKEFAISKCFVPENIYFYELFIEIAAKPTKEQLETALNNFVRVDGIYELNIRADTRKQVDRDLTKTLAEQPLNTQKAIEILGTVNDYIMNSLGADILHRYLKTCPMTPMKRSNNQMMVRRNSQELLSMLDENGILKYRMLMMGHLRRHAEICKSIHHQDCEPLLLLQPTAFELPMLKANVTSSLFDFDDC